MSSIELFKTEIPELVSFFPKLKEVPCPDGIPVVRGELDIRDGNGTRWETYQIEIKFKDGFPNVFPAVFEIGGKIPRIADWHIYEDTSACCIAVDPEERLICKNGITLTDFVKHHVLPYFFNQTHRKVEGYYPNGEFSHGIYGVYEFYSEILRTNGNVRETIRLMSIIASIERPGRTYDCFCGSKEKFRRCHKNAYDRLSPLGKKIIYFHANEFAKMAAII